jgi:tetratricopeptide (TPR) repeat protein
VEKLLHELSRRKVFSALLIYAMVAWLILQVADVIAEPLLLPAWIQRTLVIAAILGFPIVAVLSWIFDLTKSGLVATQPTNTDHRRPMGYASLSLTVLCLLGLSVLISRQWEVDVSELTVESGVVSLAILPFEGSPNAVEAHLVRFSEELSVRLGNNSKIRLASDNAISALPLNSELENSAIQLGVKYVIGGTITQASEGINLSVWLFDSDDAEEVWERDFKNAQIYVVNDLVVNELLTFFELQQDGRGVLTNNANAYDLYLRGLQSLATESDQSAAVGFFEQALAEDSRFPLPHASLCANHVREYRALRSIEAFESAERYCFRALTLGDGSLEVHEAMGQIYLASGQLDKARDSFNAALAVNGQHFESKLGLARSYLIEDPIYAESILFELMREQPGDDSVYSTQQYLYFNLGRYEEAVEPARLALRLNPQDEASKFNLAANLLLAGYFAQAKELLLAMLESDSPRSGSIQSNLATVYFFEGDYAAAAQLYTEALDREPENALFARNLADATWHQRGSAAATPMFESVIQLSQRHLQINAENIEVLSCLMVAFGSVGNQQGLEATLNSLRKLGGEDPQVYYDAAVAYARLGNIELSTQQAILAKELGYPSALIQADPDLGGAGINSVSGN